MFTLWPTFTLLSFGWSAIVVDVVGYTMPDSYCLQTSLNWTVVSREHSDSIVWIAIHTIPLQNCKINNLSLTKHCAELTAAKRTVFQSLCMRNIRINVKICIKISFYISRAFPPALYPAACWTDMVTASNIDLPTVTLYGPARDLLHGHSAHSGPVLGRPLSTLSQLSVQLRRLYIGHELSRLYHSVECYIRSIRIPLWADIFLQVINLFAKDDLVIAEL